MVAPVAGSSATRFLRATPFTVPKLPPTMSLPSGLTASVCTALSSAGAKPGRSAPVDASYATRWAAGVQLAAPAALMPVNEPPA
jgi:hypothetical protein